MEGSKHIPKYTVRKGYHRKAYVKSDGTKVKATNVPSTRIPVKGRASLGLGKGKKVIPTLRKGELSQFGYHANVPEKTRHSALKKAVLKYGQRPVEKKLIAVSTLNKYTNPKVSKIFKKDEKYVAKL